MGRKATRLHWADVSSHGSHLELSEVTNGIGRDAGSATKHREVLGLAWGCFNKIPDDGLTNNRTSFSQSWRLEVWDQGAGLVGRGSSPSHRIFSVSAQEEGTRELRILF